MRLLRLKLIAYLSAISAGVLLCEGLNTDIVRADDERPSAASIEAITKSWPVSRQLPQPQPASIPEETLKSLDMPTAVRLAEERNPVILENLQSFKAAQDSLGSDFATWWPVFKF